MAESGIFSDLPKSKDYGEGFDDGHKVGARQLALFREYFLCHETMRGTISSQRFAEAAARANELRAILSGEKP